VFVIGMHRSGTSAMAGMLSQLGITGPSEDDLIPATSSNARGHFESKLLTRIDNQLLRLRGGTWSAPPSVASGWELEPSIVAVKDFARRAFHTTFPSRPMAWKDPRNCIVLPFWRSVLTPPVAAVFVYRDGLEVARSLRARDHFTLTHGLGLWERYLRSASANLDGLPTFVAGYGGLLDDPASTCSALVRFLADIGITVPESAVRHAVASLDAGLRHERPSADEPSDLADSQHDLFARLDSLAGAHHPWHAPDLGVEPSWVDDVLSLRRDYDVLNRQIHSSRSMRLVEIWGRVRGARRSPPAVDPPDL
jgi:hypothetical protein